MRNKAFRSLTIMAVLIIMTACNNPIAPTTPDLPEPPSPWPPPGQQVPGERMLSLPSGPIEVLDEGGIPTGITVNLLPGTIPPRSTVSGSWTPASPVFSVPNCDRAECFEMRLEVCSTRVASASVYLSEIPGGKTHYVGSGGFEVAKSACGPNSQGQIVDNTRSSPNGFAPLPLMDLRYLDIKFEWLIPGTGGMRKYVTLSLPVWWYNCKYYQTC